MADDSQQNGADEATAHEEQEADGYQEPPRTPATKVSADKKVIAKFLLSNAAAGSIIGKGGATISEFQEQSSARIQLSRSNDFYPGTSDRVMLVSGPVNQVLTALHLIVGKIKSEPQIADSVMTRDGKSTQLRLLVPAPLCGTIIGKGGATIKSFHEDSHANITVSSMDKVPPGATDRIVRLTGELEHIMRALALLLSKLAENPNYSKWTTNSVSYGAYANGGPGHLGHALATMPMMAGALPTVTGKSGQTELTMPVPDNRVGVIIGKGGEVINQLKNVVGVNIRISSKDDLIPGTRDRKVTIMGPAECVQIAQVLITNKLNQASGPPPS
jgi:RNA-binding protein Nova